MPPARDVADGECVRRWRTTDERKRYDDFATLYALARALEKLERAYVRSSVDAKAYERACVDLTSKFKTLRSVLRDSVPDLDRFLETYGARVPAARRRLEAGVPATAEHGGAARGTEAEGRAEARAVADATHCFIGVMDTVKLDMRAKDQVAPALGDLLLALCKVSRLPNDFEGTKCVRKWVLRLDEMRASEVLEEEETREFLYEIENAYSTFLASLGG
jgi:ESCRT-I complex subunit VPS28